MWRGRPDFVGFRTRRANALIGGRSTDTLELIDRRLGGA